MSEDPIQDISLVFTQFASHIEQETLLKEQVNLAVKDLEKCAYSALTTLEKVHHPQGLQNICTICQEVEKDLVDVTSNFEKLNGVIPSGEYYKYHVHFRSATQKLVHASVFKSYLQENRLLDHSEVAEKLGLCKHRVDGFHLDLEDYLLGCLSIGQDLSRLSVNSVSAGDYNRPYQISEFLRDLHAAYSLLNPKHELRKRFDELKYSLKKAEDVVYNLSLRGLKPPDCEKSG